MGQSLAAVRSSWAAAEDEIDPNSVPPQDNESSSESQLQQDQEKAISQERTGVDWAAVAAALKRNRTDDAATLLSVDPSIKKQLEDKLLGVTVADRLVAVVHLRYFAAVRDQSHSDAARFAVLYTLVGGDTRQAMEFLKQQTLEALERLHSLNLNRVKSTLGAQDASKSLKLEPMHVAEALSRLVEAVINTVQKHAYIDQAFSSPHHSLSLLTHLQSIVDKAASEYFALFLESWKLELIQNEFLAKSKLPPASLLSPSMLLDLLEEFSAISQQVESYKWYLRKQYEISVEQLKERGWTFFNDPDKPDRVHLRELNIINYVVEPREIYLQLDRWSQVFVPLERIWLLREIDSALSSSSSSSESSETNEAQSSSNSVAAAAAASAAISTDVDSCFLAMQRASERSFATRNVKIVEAFVSETLPRAVAIIFEILTQRRLRAALPTRTVAVAIARTAANASSMTSLLKNTLARVTVGLPAPKSDSSNAAAVSAAPAAATTLNPKMWTYIGDVVHGVQYVAKFVNIFRTLRKTYFKFESTDETALLDMVLGDWKGTQTGLTKQHIQQSWTAIFDALDWTAALRVPLDLLRSASYDFISASETEPEWPSAIVAVFKEGIFKAAKSAQVAPITLNSLLEFTIQFICSEIEASMSSKRFSFLGAMQIDADVRRLFVSFADLSSGSPVRQYFTRIRQITSLLSSETLSDVVESWNLSEDSSVAAALSAADEDERTPSSSSSPTVPHGAAPKDSSRWKVSGSEIKSLLKCRLDFSPAAIDKLVLEIPGQKKSK
eukprot:TRINITY_DN5624_c0_g2_i1.p1 TRINITY_DN5624_c0_g2~~TRINITY_DN5624_c0_g2_i1.p1  ORF type:complete len:783 (-),score=186.60 TRINITY_DN5624_c0_g2_i1:1025-3373(-)